MATSPDAWALVDMAISAECPDIICPSANPHHHPAQGRVAKPCGSLVSRALRFFVSLPGWSEVARFCRWALVWFSWFLLARQSSPCGFCV